MGVRILKSMKEDVILGGAVCGNMIKVWCPYCHKFHNHGYDVNEKYPAYRASHCSTGPLVSKQYLIMPIDYNKEYKG